MSRPTMETRRVSIATIVPTRNKDDGNWLQGRKLTPYTRLPNSYVQMGQTPQNSYAPGFELEPAASPRKIGLQQSPRPVAGHNLICSSYVAQRLMSFRRRDDQENEGSGATDIQLSYRNKNVPSSSVRDITKRLADGRLDQDMGLKSDSFTRNGFQSSDEKGRLSQIPKPVKKL
ncbi:hypothetical protein QFC21_000834 [Naganishia friedmannii]|uniref:Uncharacterized protein n=1 Tax=Naganishia friedmannii TaxID=89922 RepID=A0ACC2W843_9TREE|nr:hypothetical protein QFC21_000834 [Naganishia friedmannii]